MIQLHIYTVMGHFPLNINSEKEAIDLAEFLFRLNEVYKIKAFNGNELFFELI